MLSFVRVAAPVLLLISATQPALAQKAQPFPTIGEVISNDPAFAELVDPDAKIEVLASGFKWTEGPLWVSEKGGPGYLLFSDIPRNSIMKWSAAEGLSLFMKPAGYTGISDYGNEPGSNGLSLDAKGRLVCCEHGDRRVSVLTDGGGKLTIADRFEGKRFNSPNDVVVKSNGDLYFTDPPYGLGKQLDDPKCELDFCGVYRATPDGKVTLLTKELTRPNGIAFSPDESILYVPQSDPKNAILMSYKVKKDGTLAEGKVLYDFTKAVPELPGLPDGMDVDKKGNLFITAPGGVSVLTSDGKLLGRISTNGKISNCTFGGPDRSVLYMTADSYLCRIQTKTSK